MQNRWRKAARRGRSVGLRNFVVAIAGSAALLGASLAFAVPITSSRMESLAPPSDALPESVREILIEATAALLKSRFAESEVLARQAIERAPGSPDAWQILGYALANLERYDEAIAALDEAAERYDENAGPLVIQAEIYLHLGQSEKARDSFERAVKVEPGNRRALESLGAMALQRGDIDSSIAYYERAVRDLDTDELGLRPELAALYLRNGKPEAARSLLSHWADLPSGTPDNVVALLGRTEAELGQTRQAQRFFEARMSRDAPLEAYVDLATFHRNQLNFAEAERILRKAAGEFPDSTVPWNELGRTYGGQANYEAALEAFTTGLEVMPGDPVLLRGVRLSEFRLGRLDAAQAVAARLASQADADTSDHVWLGSIEQARGNGQAAVAAYRAAVEADPRNWVAHNNLASLLTDTDPDQALAQARAAAELAGSNPSVRDTLGWALFKSGDVSGAHTVLSELTMDAPEDPTAAYKLGRVLLEMGKTAEGQSELRRALDLDGSFSFADDARKRLAN